MTAMDIVVIATPIAAIMPTVQSLIPHLSPHTVLTDVGSVKAPIVNQLAPLWPNFIGGHPMAGTAHQGIEAIEQYLFRDRPYVLTPTSLTPSHQIQPLKSMIDAIGANLIQCEPQDHDRAVALISHLPVMVSTNLISTSCNQDEDVTHLAQQLASSGFADTSRVGGGNPELGIMMAKFNQEALLASLTDYQHHLAYLAELIKTEQWETLEGILHDNQQARPRFL